MPGGQKKGSSDTGSARAGPPLKSAPAVPLSRHWKWQFTHVYKSRFPLITSESIDFSSYLTRCCMLHTQCLEVRLSRPRTFDCTCNGADGRYEIAQCDSEGQIHCH